MKPYFLTIFAALFFFACNDEKNADPTSVSEKKLAIQTLSKDIVYLTARPDLISFDVANTAVIVVDMQNDFGTKGGMFDKAGIDISIIQQVINPISNVLNTARKGVLKLSILKWDSGRIFHNLPIVLEDCTAEAIGNVLSGVIMKPPCCLFKLHLA